MGDTWPPPDLWVTSLLLCLPICVSATRLSAGSNQDERGLGNRKVARWAGLMWCLSPWRPLLAITQLCPTHVGAQSECPGPSPATLASFQKRVRDFSRPGMLWVPEGIFWFSLDRGRQGLPWIPGGDEPTRQRVLENYFSTVWACPTQTDRRWGGLMAQVRVGSQALLWEWCPQGPPSSCGHWADTEKHFIDRWVLCNCCRGHAVGETPCSIEGPCCSPFSHSLKTPCWGAVCRSHHFIGTFSNKDLSKQRAAL